MKRIYVAVLSALALTFMIACGNTGAQNKPQGKAVIELTAEEFNNLVFNMSGEKREYLGTRPAVVDFNATWCGPCQRIAPILEELAAEYKDKIVIYKVDVDKCRAIAESFGISSIPAIIYIPLEGEPVMTVGARNKDKFHSEIDTILLKK